jgi:WhiB family redox-sensing transcriptional regulator
MTVAAPIRDRWRSTRDLDSWRGRARCNGLETEIFFPISEDPEAATTAKSICRECPVRQECLAYAMSTGQPYGIWGGLTTLERRGLLRRRLPAAFRQPQLAAN